jgi:ABC-2 type transport system permease protein
MTIALAAPIALVASAGRGYLPPMAAAILALLLAQVIGAAGWGEYFPWSVPALRAGMAGPEYGHLGGISYGAVALVSALGLLGTFAWWRLTDQPL